MAQKKGRGVVTAQEMALTLSPLVHPLPDSPALKAWWTTLRQRILPLWAIPLINKRRGLNELSPKPPSTQFQPCGAFRLPYGWSPPPPRGLSPQSLPALEMEPITWRGKEATGRKSLYSDLKPFLENLPARSVYHTQLSTWFMPRKLSADN